MLGKACFDTDDRGLIKDASKHSPLHIISLQFSHPPTFSSTQSNSFSADRQPVSFILPCPKPNSLTQDTIKLNHA